MQDILLLQISRKLGLRRTIASPALLGCNLVFDDQREKNAEDQNPRRAASKVEDNARLPCCTCQN